MKLEWATRSVDEALACLTHRSVHPRDVDGLISHVLNVEESLRKLKVALEERHMESGPSSSSRSSSHSYSSSPDERGRGRKLRRTL